MHVYGLPLIRSTVLVCAIGFLLFLVNSNAWVNDQLLLEKDPTVLEDRLRDFIEYQLRDKDIPGLSISIIDNQSTLLEAGFGFSTPSQNIEATPYTVYRGGSLAQLFTTIGILQRVELDYIDLDAPVSYYLPDFNPNNPYGLPLTLRQILSHQSGLPTEPPIGHSYDPFGATLKETVMSLNATTVVYPPETFTKFSNAGFGVAGLILENTTENPYIHQMRAILNQMDLMRTSFAPRLDLKGRLAQGHILKLDGRLLPTTVYESGNTPASNLYTTANDLGTFLRVLFAEGKSPNGTILTSESIEQMWSVQLSTARRQLPYGLGFELSQLEGERRASLSSSFQGYSARIDLLPDSKIGVAILANLEQGKVALEQISSYVLQFLLAQKRELPPPSVPLTFLPDSSMMVQSVGYYEDSGSLYISALGNDLYLYKDGGRYRLRQIGDSLIVDDVHAFGTVLLSDGLSIELDKTLYIEKDPLQASPPTDLYDHLLGAYGLPQNPISIIESRGSIYAVLNWFEPYPLEQIAVDTFALPADGIYGGEKLVVVRNESNAAAKIEIANMLLDRIPENEYAYLYTSIPIEQPLISIAEHQSNQEESSMPQQSELVDLTIIDPLLNLDVRYASEDNLFNVQLYDEARVLLQQQVAEALFRVQLRARQMGYGLIIYDAYRPWRISQGLWENAPDSIRFFIEDPTTAGTCQNRAAAISLSFFDLTTGELLPMPTDYGVLSVKAHADYPFLAAQIRQNRQLLRYMMESEGFRASPYSWWHFTHQSCNTFPVIDALFEDVSHNDAIDEENIYTVR